MDDPSAGDVDYETPDGSRFSLRAIWSVQDDIPVFQHTSISAQVEGQAFTGRLSVPPHDVDDGDVLNALEPVPPGCVHPKFPQGFKEFRNGYDDMEADNWYYKAPSYTYDDCQPGRTFVADCFLNEASVYEYLRDHEAEHPNIGDYFGCVVKDGYITHIALKRYAYSLGQFVSRRLSKEDKDMLLSGVECAINHLHSLGFAHNDVNPDNVCVVDNRSSGPTAVLIDLDGCLPFGKKLLKGVDVEAKDGEQEVSRALNDFHGLELIRRFLFEESDM